MEYMISIQNILIVFISFIIGLFFRSFFPSYFKEKGKNLATKEDIEGITNKIERIRSEYSSNLELVKAELNKQLHIHKISSEKEFEILSELWRALAQLKNATSSLRPEGDIIDERISEQERKKQRLNIFFENYYKFLEIVQYNKPFYPKEIYEDVNKIMRISMHEAIGYKNRSPDYDDKGYDPKYWDRAVENINQITVSVDKVCEKISNRFYNKY